MNDQEIPAYRVQHQFHIRQPTLVQFQTRRLSADGQLITIKIQVPKPGSREYARKG